MDENRPPEPEPQPAPTVTSQPAPTSISTGASMTGGPVPFSGPPDASVAQDEKTQALLMWILSLFISFVSPLIFYFISNEKPFVKQHAGQALAFNIVMFIIAVILIITVVGMLLLPVISIAGLVVIILGAIAANAGSRIDIPVTGGFAKSWFKS